MKRYRLLEIVVLYEVNQTWLKWKSFLVATIDSDALVAYGKQGKFDEQRSVYKKIEM